VCPLALLNGVAQRDGDMRLPHQLIEILRPILPIEADIGHPATTRRILPDATVADDKRLPTSACGDIYSANLDTFRLAREIIYIA